uniref:hypothetical protein n=1 Tax=Noviherbaspirillum aerium TaxID=2588497 RepID=UPI001CEF5D6A|nr:hypothetical protein [Noviherbaspirillum aerium]
MTSFQLPSDLEPASTADTLDILRELGMDAKKIAALRERKAFGQGLRRETTGS